MAVVGSDLWCCMGIGTIAVCDLATLQIKHKVIHQLNLHVYCS